MATRTETQSMLAKLVGLTAGGILMTCLAVHNAKPEYKERVAFAGLGVTTVLVAYRNKIKEYITKSYSHK